MSKNVFEAVERLTEELTTEERVRLARELAQRTRKDRWNRLFTMIDERVKRFGAPSEADIVRLCHKVRRERSATRRRA